jgi:ABC-2 type transport system permease protein
MLTPITFGLIIWAPMVSMRLFAEEQKLGTLELLLTSPVRDWEIVVGKFVAVAAMLLGIVIPTAVYVALLYWFADPDFGPLMTGYLGLLLYGCAAGSLGLFVSSLTSSQIVAGAVAAVALFFLTLAAQAADLVEGPPATLLEWVSLPAHYTSFVEGVIALQHLTYFATFIVLFLLLTTLSLEARRWR